MENKNYIILIAIVILAIALICISVYIATPNNNNTTVNNNTTIENNTNNTNNVIMIDKDGNVNNNTTTHNNTNTSNETYRVYNPQTDSYVTVIGEGYDAEVDRWYTYDTDGVRYYNTRIK